MPKEDLDFFTTHKTKEREIGVGNLQSVVGHVGFYGRKQQK